MPFPFSFVCDLLENSHRAVVSHSRLDSTAAAARIQRKLVVSWFRRHRDHVDAADADVSALLSTLLPDKRTDRVYCVGVTRLEKLVGRALLLGPSRLQILSRYRRPGSGLDLGDCVEAILRETPNPASKERHAVTVEEVDQLLHVLAARIKWSSPAIRATHSAPCSLFSQPECDSLAALFRRLPARDAKWLVRVVLKDFQPVVLDADAVCASCDPLLPPLLKIREDFTSAVSLLPSVRREFSRRPPMSASEAKAGLTAVVGPRLGVKVGRQRWVKGRSIKHCLDMGDGRMSVEKKIDGEYCQIHVDLSKGRNVVQIFSKNGKDSTEDRSKLIGAIRDSLELGSPSCKLSNGCILEGELVVYSDKKQKVMPFDKIRKYVSRRGRYLDTECDSQRHTWEHLMIVYYDVLLIDEESLLAKPHSERFDRLSKLISVRAGSAELVERQVISFDHRSAASDLRRAFARVITARHEGLVLKPDEPYFSFGAYARARACAFTSCCIKLKKEYIGSFGDVGNFAVVGAGFDPVKARRYDIPGLKWTYFYVGCLTNKDAVSRWDATPEFTVVNVIEVNQTQLRTIMAHGNPVSVPFNEYDNDNAIVNANVNANTGLGLGLGLRLTIPRGVDNGRKPHFVFTNPLVFDLRCFSFQCAGNTGFLSLRFPSVSKVHFDCSFRDTISFDELQATAREATIASETEDSQDMLRWIAALESADPRGVPVDAVSQLTTSTITTPSFAAAACESYQSSQSSSKIAPQEPSTVREGRPHTLQGDPDACKRPAAEVAFAQPSAKRKRQELGTDARMDTGAGTASCPIDLTSSQSSLAPSPGGPLKEMDPNTASSQGQWFGIDKSQSLPPRKEDTETFAKTGMTIAGGSPLLTASPRPQHDSKEKQITSSTGNVPCRYAGPRCQLARREVLIAPTVTAASHSAHALLAAHGICPVTDPNVWVQASSSPSVTGWRRRSCGRKICLVDATSREKKIRATEYMRTLQELPLRMPDGSKEIVAVYDWRVLESLGRVEDDECADKELDKLLDPWRRWLVGYV